MAVGKEIARLRPDVILMSTPHGVSDIGMCLASRLASARAISISDKCMSPERFQFYLGATATGSRDSYSLHCQPVTINLDGKRAIDLVNTLKASSKVGAMTGAFGGYGPPGACSRCWMHACIASVLNAHQLYERCRCCRHRHPSALG